MMQNDRSRVPNNLDKSPKKGCKNHKVSHSSSIKVYDVSQFNKTTAPEKSSTVIKPYKLIKNKDLSVICHTKDTSPSPSPSPSPRSIQPSSGFVNAKYVCFTS